MRVCETRRLRLRWLCVADAPFILELLNDPDFVRNIGDRQIRTQADAERYLLEGPLASYERWGHGLYRVELRDRGTPVGICGLLRRDGLDAPDVGFALLPRFRGAGLAREAAEAVLRHGKAELGVSRIVAIASPENATSMHILEQLGMRFDRLIQLPGQMRPTCLFVPAQD